MWCARKTKFLIGIFMLFLIIGTTNSVIPSSLGTTYDRLIIQPQLSEVLRYINDTYFVTCSSHNGTKIRWLNPRNEIITNTKGRIHIEERESTNGKRSLALVFTQMIVADHGNYTCSVEDGTIKKSFSLVINEPIVFVDTPIIQTANESTDATIKCEVRGHPIPLVTWSFNGQAIDFDNDKKYIRLGDGLLIKRVTRDDSGEYTCKAYQESQTFTNLQEQTIKLNVEHKPILVVHEKLDIVHGFIDGQVNLTCSAQAEPLANFKWYKNEKKISPSKNQFFDGNNLSVLQLTIYNQSYFGEYICQASNRLGTVDHIISLKEHPKPKPPANFTLRGVNSETLDIKIVPSNQTGISDLKGFRIQYIPVADFEKQRNWKKSAQIDFQHTNEVFLLTHLKPDTNYLVRVGSGNVAGFSDFTESKEFKTSIKDPNTNSSNKLPINFFITNLISLFYVFQNYV